MSRPGVQAPIGRSRALRAVFAGVLLASVVSGSGLAQERLTLVVPGAPWTLTLPRAAFEIQPARISPDGKRGYFVASDRQSGLTVSFFIEPVEKCKSSRECRDLVQRLGFAHLGAAENIAGSEIGGISVVECFVAEYQGQPVRRQHLYAEFVVQNYWADMHVWKASYTPADRDQFVQLVKEVRFAPKERSD